MRRCECEGKAANGLRRQPARGLARDMGGMVVENDLDRGVGRIGGIEQLEKFNEFAAAVAFLDEGVNVTGEQIDTGHQGQGAVGVCTRDHASRLGGCRAVAGDPARSYRSPGSRASRRKRRWRGPTGAVLALGVLPFRPQHRHLPVDTQDLGDLGLERGIALF